MLLGLLAVGAILVLRTPGLGWDEAVYATKARSFVTDVPASAWNLFRPPGLAYLGVLAVPFGFSDETVRMVSMALAVAGLGAFGLLGGLVGGRAAGLAAMLVAGTMPIVLIELPLFHNDLLSAGVLCALMALLWHQLEVRPAPDWRLLLAPLLAASAFYLRFGALAAIAAIGLVAVLLWWRPLARAWRTSLGAVAIGGVLALPHVWLAITETGSPVGILTLSVDKVNTTGPIEAIETYLRALPFGIAGPIGLAFIAAGVGFGIMVAVGLVRRRPEQRGPEARQARRDTLGVTWLLLPAGLTTVALLLVSHAEARYLTFPVLLLSLAGAIGLHRALSAAIAKWRPQSAARVGRALFAGFVVVVAAVTIRNAATRPRGAPDQAAFVGQTGAWIRDHAAGQPCLVVSTVYPILGWYAGCAADEFMLEPGRLLPDDAPLDRTYLVFTSVDGRRRTAAELERYRAIASDPIAAIGTPERGAEIRLVSPP